MTDDIEIKDLAEVVVRFSGDSGALRLIKRIGALPSTGKNED